MTVDDIEELAAINAGDEEAMQRFFYRHATTVYRYVLSRTQDQTLATDILDVVMLVVWQQAGSYQKKASISSWLIGIARHKLLDHFRREKRHHHDELDETSADDSPLSDQLVAAAQNREWVKHCISHLNQLQREMIHLAFYEDMAYPEIARILNCPTGTVKSRMYHARKALRLCLERFAGRGTIHAIT